MLVLPAGNPSPWTGPTGNNTYLLPGAVPTLIDAGVGDPEHVAALASALGGAPLALVLITHAHADHASGADAIVARWPRARVRNRGSAAIRDDEPIAAGDTDLRAIHTPGHAPDHFCFFDSTTGDLFCGDLVRAEGTIVIPASRGGDLAQYLESLRRIRALAPRRLLPGHGPPISEPLSLIENYLQHRADRESQIISAVRGGARRIDEIVAGVYGPLPLPIVAAASDSVLAHLIKLQGDGVVVNRGGAWCLE